jgi:hypothetical protein
MRSSAEASNPPGIDSHPGQTSAAQAAHGDWRLGRCSITTNSFDVNFKTADML